MCKNCLAKHFNVSTKLLDEKIKMYIAQGCMLFSGDNEQAFIPAYCFIPKPVLSKCGFKLNSILRNPRRLLCDWDAIAAVESNLFQLLITDAYTVTV